MAEKDGARKGPGRPKGAVNKATKQHRERLSDLARQHTEAALNALVEVCMNGSDTARVSAATALLDRGHGKPVQHIAGDDEAPLIHKVVYEVLDAPNRAE